MLGNTPSYALGRLLVFCLTTPWGQKLFSTKAKQPGWPWDSPFRSFHNSIFAYLWAHILPLVTSLVTASSSKRHFLNWKKGFYCIWTSPSPTGSRCAVQAGFELTVPLAQALCCWDDSYKPPCPAAPHCLQLDWWRTVNETSFSVRRKIRALTDVNGIKYFTEPHSGWVGLIFTTLASFLDLSHCAHTSSFTCINGVCLVFNEPLLLLKL